ncbi:MAG: phosphopentomutase, partial [Christensenellales bacterium]
YRTSNRRDYSLLPPKETIMDKLSAKGFDCIGIGKIHDIFSGQGLTDNVVAHTNEEVSEATLKVMERDFNGLCFVNLVDTDMVYGHRNDVDGYRKCVERFDAYVPEMISRLRDDDMFIITADHGCDPATPSTDHSRENVPYLCYVKNRKGRNLGTIEGFDFIAKAVYKYLTGEEFAN